MQIVGEIYQSRKSENNLDWSASVFLAWWWWGKGESEVNRGSTDRKGKSFVSMGFYGWGIDNTIGSRS